MKLKFDLSGFAGIGLKALMDTTTHDVKTGTKLLIINSNRFLGTADEITVQVTALNNPALLTTVTEMLDDKFPTSTFPLVGMATASRTSTATEDIAIAETTHPESNPVLGKDSSISDKE